MSPLAQRDDVDAGEGEALEEARGVVLVASDAIQRFGEHQVEPRMQRIPHECLELRAQQRGSPSCVVSELLCNRPTLPRGGLAADAQRV